MTMHEEYECFVAQWGGPARIYEHVAKSLESQSGEFTEALSNLVESNTFAKFRVAEILKILTASGNLGDVVPIPFQGTPETHGNSTDDDFFKAKSERYLHNAELQHSMDEVALTNEDGWPDADKDIGDA